MEAIIKTNNSGFIYKMKTKENLDFSKIKKIAIKNNLVITDHQGDFLTLTFSGKKCGLQVSNVATPSAYNDWNLTSGHIYGFSGVDMAELEKLQIVFEDLKNL